MEMISNENDDRRYQQHNLKKFMIRSLRKPGKKPWLERVWESQKYIHDWKEA